MYIYQEQNPMLEITKEIESFSFYYYGKKFNVNKHNKKFQTLIEKTTKVFSNSKVMPAFGVSLHHETQNAMKHGIWVEINFKEQITINELPFSSLLVKLEKANGINLIRKYNGKYEGRCIYLDFDEELDLVKIIN